MKRHGKAASKYVIKDLGVSHAKGRAVRGGDVKSTTNIPVVSQVGAAVSIVAGFCGGFFK